MAEGASGPASLEDVRKRIDAIDAELLGLVAERAGLAKDVAAAKAAAGDAGKFGLRPAREAQLLRKLLASRQGPSPSLIVRICRELIGDSLATQGPFRIAVWGEAGGLNLFKLAGFYQADDARLARAPGRLSGVIGAAPAPLDV